MTDIKVFKIVRSDAKTDGERRAQYDKWRAASQEFESFLWTAWLEIETAAPTQTLQKSNILSVQLKTILQYAVALCDGNPHFGALKDPPGAIWLQSERDIIVMDFSFKQYRMPKDERFRVGGLQLWWRKNAGAKAPTAHLHQNAIEWMYPDAYLSSAASIDAATGVATAVVATARDAKNTIMLDKAVATDIDPYIDEINVINLWYRMNASLAFLDQVRPVAIINLPAPKQVLAPVADRALRAFQPYIPIRVVAASRDAVIADIAQMDLLDTFYKKSLLPATSVAAVEREFAAMSLLKQHRFDTQQASKNETYKDFIARSLYDRSFVDLTKTEAERVMAQYAKKRSALDDPESKRLIKTINRAFSAAITDVFEMRRVQQDIGRYVASKDAMVKIRDAVICPHYLQMVEETARGPRNNLGQIDTQAVTENIVQRWAERVPVNFKYYCRVCGELLMTDDMDNSIVFDQKVISSSSDKDPLWYYILSETGQIVRRVKFLVPQNIKSFVLAITNTMEREMNTAQQELQKSKTKSLEDIKNIMIITISCYCYAFLANMIINNPRRYSWITVSASGGSTSRQQAALATLSTAYNLLIDSNQNRISAIKDFNIDAIKPILLRGFEWAKNVKFSNLEADAPSASEEALEWTTRLVNDPWFNLLYTMRSAHAAKHLEYTNFREILGDADPRRTLCDAKPFARVWRPAAGAKDHHEQCYLSAIEYVDRAIFMEIAVPRSPVLHAWFREWNFLAEEDARHGALLRSGALRPAVPGFYDNRRGQVPVYPALDISLVKCPTGVKHDFSMWGAVYVFKSGARLKLRELILNTKALGAIVDERCGNCGMSKYAKPLAQVAKTLETVIDKTNFFRYFENRCPLADLHEYDRHGEAFVGNSECRRCGFRASYIADMPSAYYAKYRALAVASARANMPLEPLQRTWTPKKSDKWNVTLASILQLSNVSNISYNLWINLGLTERRNFTQLKLGKINPQSTIDDAASAARLPRLVGYFYWVQKQYLLIKNHAKIVIPAALKVLIESDPQIISMHESFNSSMPDLIPDFAARLEYYQYCGHIKITCNYVLHSLCQALLTIRGLTALKKLAHRLFDYLVANIMMSEESLSELEVVKIHTVERAAEDDTEAEGDVTADVAEADDDDIDEVEKPNADPFSLDDCDIENANTGDDDD
jgi:hypothetical protein